MDEQPDLKFSPLFDDDRIVSKGRAMLTGYWWDYSYMRSYQGSIKIRGKDFHEVSEEEYYDSLLDD